MTEFRLIVRLAIALGIVASLLVRDTNPVALAILTGAVAKLTE